MKKILNLLICATAYFSHIAGMERAASDTSSRMTELFNVIKEHTNEKVKQIITEFPQTIHMYHRYNGKSKILFGEVTPLHVAVRKDNKPIVELLLIARVDCNAQTQGFGQQDTPLHVVKSPEIVQLLVQHRASVHMKNVWGHAPLYAALFHFRRPNFGVAQSLVDAGADVNERLLKNSTLLHKATMRSWAEDTVMFLLKNGADRTLRDDEGETALEFSQARDSYLAMTILECFKAVPEQK
jgi:hypothetical protein